jgi:uncharacterized membrane protein (DUF2068 family)
MERDASKSPDHRAHASLRAIALIEVGKGVLALLATGSIATFGAARIDKAIDRLASLSHFDTVHRALSAIASDINPASVQLVAAMIAAYGALRLAEGWGLWHARAWASWLGAVSVALYLPFDAYASVRYPGWIAFVALAINLAILWILTRDLLGRRKTSHAYSARDTRRESDL